MPDTHPEPELTQHTIEPKGALQKNMKMFVFLGASLLVILASVFSAGGKKSSTKGAAKNQPPQPIVQDNTDNNVADLKNQLAAEREKEQQNALAATAAADPALANATPAQRVAAAGYTPTGLHVGCIPGQPCPVQNGYPQQQAGGTAQLSPTQQEAQQLAAKERERDYNARFSSNIAYARPVEQPQTGQTVQPSANAYAFAASDSMIAPRAAGESAQSKRAPEVNLDSAAGQPYVIYEGLTMDTVLMNRLDGDAPGPVKVLVSNPVYSHDHQHVLIPDGTIVLGEAKKIGAAGFGQQRRMAVAFHRMIMPDGYSVDLDQFHGLDQIGEEGLKDMVNNHYLEIFGTSIALGIVAGAGQITAGGGTITTSGSQAFTTGAASSVSQSATTILDRFIQIPPTITIREGHRVKVYFTQDMLLPAYTNHSISQTF
jgi:type IV secretory pathway VirB10-like protein